jgi:Kef-type K+ transport system membrane component KefB
MSMLLQRPTDRAAGAAPRRRLLLHRPFLMAGLALLSFAVTGASGGHAGDVARVLVAIIVMLVTARLGGHLFAMAGQPAVLGELIGGILLGNLALVGFGGLEFIAEDPIIAVLAELGVILLLFEVGLESTVREMMAVGGESLLVAALGVVAPFALGFGVGHLFLPEESIYVHLFLGATLCATSVGLTARVMKDLGKIQTREAKIILGAAVIDDVMGLIILATVVGVITAADHGTAMSLGSIAWIVGKSSLVLGLSLALGMVISPRLFLLASKLRVGGMLLTMALLICFGLSWLAHLVGLAPIVGAFAAGLILEDTHFRDFDKKTHDLEELIHPIGLLLVPLFFVRMGAQVDLTTFADVSILGFAATLTIAAIIGKQICSLGILSKGTNRLAVGLGMIPRGEVGLIFAAIGASLLDPAGHRVIAPSTYSAVVIMVIVTTMVTPPLLKWALGRKGSTAA